MRMLAGLVLVPLAVPALGAQVPQVISADPPRDSANPARMEVLHIPSGGVAINGVAYIAAGADRHPTLILFHGLPGNEKNMDVAQAVRRAGWNVIAASYRGSWGNPGVFRFGGNLEDAEAILAFARDSANARRLGIDPARIVLAGHSMGGWVTALTASRHPELLGAIMVSAADIGKAGAIPLERRVALMSRNMESLAGVTAQGMAEELGEGAPRWRLELAAPGLAHLPMLVLTSNDGLARDVEPLVRRLRELGNANVTTAHQATDHSWSDSRIALQVSIVEWLAQRRGAGAPARAGASPSGQ